MTTASLSRATRLRPAGVIVRPLLGPRPEHLARRAVSDLMTDLDVTGDRPDVEMVVNELVTNARQHAPGPYALRIFIGPESVKIAVLDGGSDYRQVAHKLAQAGAGAPADAESGRGLQIVTGLFPGSCGAEPVVTCTRKKPAKQIWIRLPLPGQDAPGRAGGSEAEDW